MLPHVVPCWEGHPTLGTCPLATGTPVTCQARLVKEETTGRTGDLWSARRRGSRASRGCRCSRGHRWSRCSSSRCECRWSCRGSRCTSAALAVCCPQTSALEDLPTLVALVGLATGLHMPWKIMLPDHVAALGARELCTDMSLSSNLILLVARLAGRLHKTSGGSRHVVCCQLWSLLTNCCTLVVCASRPIPTRVKL